MEADDYIIHNNKVDKYKKLKIKYLELKLKILIEFIENNNDLDDNYENKCIEYMQLCNKLNKLKLNF